MFSKMMSIRPPAWGLLSALCLLAITSAVARATDVIPSKLFLYAIQPGMAVVVAALAANLSRGQHDRVRHRDDKAYLVGSVLAVWFVLYFLSGLLTTYVHNSLVGSLRSIVVNLWVFGMVAFAVEYARHAVMLLVNRRNLIWFGVVVATVLAVQQMNFGLIPQVHGLDDFVKLCISDFIPALLASFLLTYLAITAGFPAMLVYRLGLVATLILPPIVPKYDWYLQGVSMILLTVAVYIAVDRARQTSEAPQRRSRHHPQRAYDIMWMAVMLCLVLFMLGAFTYKPAAIASNSMKPVFSRGSIVIVQKLHDPMDVRIGDIVQYKRKETMITHRVVAIDASADGSGKRVFIFKGDNNQSADPVVAQSQLVGIVRAKIPLIGYPTIWLQETAKHSRAGNG